MEFSAMGLVGTQNSPLNLKKQQPQACGAASLPQIAAPERVGYAKAEIDSEKTPTMMVRPSLFKAGSRRELAGT